jgi:hypothetical protein
VAPSARGPIHPSRKGFYTVIRRHTRAPGLERVATGREGDEEVVAACQRIASSVRDRLGFEGYGSDELRAFMATEENVAPVRTVPGLPDQ